MCFVLDKLLGFVCFLRSCFSSLMSVLCVFVFIGYNIIEVSSITVDDICISVFIQSVLFFV